MGVLTQTMTMLQNEIVSAKRARQASQKEREQQTADRRSQVSALCTGFARDLAGAHRAWLGRTTAEPTPTGKQSQRRPAESVSATAKAKPKRHAASAPKPAVKKRVRRVPPVSKRKVKSSKH
jgi:hypothetical protein